MPLSYKSQIELIFPPAVFEDANIGSILQQLGIQLESKGNKILLFTDARTVAALNAADDRLQEIMRQSGIGLVVYGWNKQGRAEFVLQKLREMTRTHAGEQLKMAVFRLHLFVKDGMLGKLHPNPFAAPHSTVDPSDRFDLTAALNEMMSPQQLHAPKAPDHLRASRVFGRRNA
ncbi:hypothetical protein ASC89_20825 [Devosia sp. Root413D1]|uniref:hypothetical protein n=1 Tax=Devosia sp. Root413D1 TaxID=1736531 RepID=UPI0006FBDD05|nr:hypothetical protein [Devosia sp. Root413D1]KQW77610.1 hypothetical protein ASC89_20825 [Devosia sp. Root413D1]